MQTNDPTGHVIMEDLSDRSENSHSEFKVNGFQDYNRIKELNLSLEKIKDEPIIESKDFHFPLDACRQRSMVFDGFSGERNRDHSVSLEKSKDFTLPITKSKDPANYPMDRSSDADSFLESLCKAKDSTAAGILFNFTRDGRQKSLQTSLDRSKGPGITTDREIKGFGMLKNNLSIDRINEFNMYLDRMRDSHIGNIALDRIPPNALLDAPSMLESNYFRNFQMQPRSPDLETITLEGMRRSHLSKTERSPQNLATQLPHSITHMQHSQQQQQQQQPKSFTIDYILGHKNNPREKHQRGQQQQFRKHQGTVFTFMPK
ncbi:uncharacterized protein LOC112495097, partial [Cephus cinctus]|uniref:Uncharacterized protein LOC112495097 n=1 Tax=Cephus cinctus TaxID=211228 RepID=A0AAJ7RRD6_CEPCN